jgi:hypothetical protein
MYGFEFKSISSQLVKEKDYEDNEYIIFVYFIITMVTKCVYARL